MKWYTIPTFENYKITKCGKIKSMNTNKELTGSRNNKGYLNFRLTNDSGVKTITIGRLLLMTFNRMPINNEVCDHIDRNNQNDNLNNLRWVSSSANNSNRSSKKKFAGVYYKNMTLKNGTQKTYYQAKIGINGKTISIGYYKTDFEAHLAYAKQFENIYGVKYNINQNATL